MMLQVIGLALALLAPTPGAVAFISTPPSWARPTCQTFCTSSWPNPNCGCARSDPDVDCYCPYDEPPPDSERPTCDTRCLTAFSDSPVCSCTRFQDCLCPEECNACDDFVEEETPSDLPNCPVIGCNSAIPDSCECKLAVEHEGCYCRITDSDLLPTKEEAPSPALNYCPTSCPDNGLGKCTCIPGGDCECPPFTGIVLNPPPATNRRLL